MIRTVTRLGPALIASLGLAAAASAQPQPPSPPSPPTPQQVVEFSTGQMQQAVQHTGLALAVSTAKTVDAIGALDQSGAPAVLIFAVAQAGHQRTEVRSAQGAHRVNTVAHNALEVLDAIDAPAPAFGAVNTARQAALSAINNLRVQSHQNIQSAVESALNDEGDGAGDAAA